MEEVGDETRRSAGDAARALTAALVAAGCDMPSTGGLGPGDRLGRAVTKHYDFTGVTKVTVDSGFKVDIDYGETSEVSVTVDDNLVEEHLEVELDGDTLRIGLADLWQYRDVTLRARVVMPRITGLEVSGASSVVVTKFASGDPLAAHRVRLECREPGRRARRHGDAGRLRGEPGRGRGGDGRARRRGVRRERRRLAGSAGRTAAGRLRRQPPRPPGLTAPDADLTLSGGSRGEVTVTGTLDAEASGGSRLEYAGDPELGDIDASGGSVVEPAGN